MTVGEMETAVLAALEADTALASEVRRFMVLPSLDEDTLKQLLLQFPSVGVLSPRGVYSYKQFGVQDETATVLVVCVQRNLRSQASAASGDVSALGVWDLLDECRRTIEESRTICSYGILDCTARQRQLLHTAQGWTSAMLELEVLLRRGS